MLTTLAAQNWGMFVLRGILALALGVLAFAAPVTTLVSLGGQMLKPQDIERFCNAPSWRERGFASCPLQFNFLGDGRNGITHLVDDRLQCIGRYIEPPSPGTNLN